MSLLASLARAYDRLPDAPPYGFSTEKIGFAISLNAYGSVAAVIDLRGEGKKRPPRMVMVPQAVKRTVGIASNFLWDKTAYVLGRTAGEGKRTAQEHQAFKDRHADWLARTDDAGLMALSRFLDRWTPDQTLPGWSDDLTDLNAIFVYEPDRLAGIWLHDRPAARDLWRRRAAEGASEAQICLVNGEPGPVARLHPSIKGVWGAQSSGAALVSFNLDAFTSYGHEQGDNAPVSEAAAFAYTTALNRFLDRDSGHRVQIGDASTVFWADASDRDTAEEAEGFFGAMFGVDTAAEETAATKEIGIKLEMIRKGMPLAQVAPELDQGVRFHVLGLAPNAARLSVRFYWQDDFGVLAERYAAYSRDIAFEPWPQGRRAPTLTSAVLRTAPARRDDKGRFTFDRDRISPLLAGELARAVLTGTRFPGALLPLLLMRVRCDHLLDSTRAALVKGLIVRDMRLDGRLPLRSDGTPMEDYLVRPDPDDPNPARRLGRLFAMIERAQLAALGNEVNATVKDKFLGAAAATPQRVFPGLLKGAEKHVRRLRNGHSDAKWIKDADHARRTARSLERKIGTLGATFGEGFPAQHSAEEQGLFLIGYYQERFGSAAASDRELQDDSTEITEGEE